MFASIRSCINHTEFHNPHGVHKGLVMGREEAKRKLNKYTASKNIEYDLLLCAMVIYYLESPTPHV